MQCRRGQISKAALYLKREGTVLKAFKKLVPNLLPTKVQELGLEREKDVFTGPGVKAEYFIQRNEIVETLFI